MFEKPVSDAEFFGKNKWIYCNQHLAPHTTGWCTVSVHNKTLLNASNAVDAGKECKAKGFVLYKGQT